MSCVVFGEKPRAVLFPSSPNPGIVLEKNLEDDGVEFDNSKGSDGDLADSDGRGGDIVNGDGGDEANDQDSSLKCEGSNGVNLECHGDEGQSSSDCHRSGSASPMNVDAITNCKDA